MARAFDAARNESQWSTVEVTVANAAPPTDSVPPVVTVPANATVEATGPGGAGFNYSASATDNVDGPLSTTCDPVSGSEFPLGATAVACSATDAGGNTGWASFTVAVVDTTAPTIAVPGDIAVEGASAAGAVVTYAASASDVVDGSVPVTCVPPSGSTFPVGTTTVTCTARDAAGNEASASFVVRVRQLATRRNHVPRAQPARYTIQAGATLSGVLKARDRDGDTLTFSLVSGPSMGTAAVDAATGAFTYTPGAVGRDAFTFQVSDGTATSNIATVAIRIKRTAPKRTRADDDDEDER
jgi:hypothetical protein